ncbi:MAG TPA: hypothetical protein VFX05_03155 [Casimicrobiaceae bacterium]|nr:hypothetical protein [Casimicrobiaceae bacterium]
MEGRLAEPLTLFSFGYWGWGNAVPHLLHAIDAVEAARGYAPPLFADIRISRAVRAKGFDGDAFAREAGASRYRWLRTLGNVAVKEGGPMRIQEPSAANDLLDAAVACARERRRLLFFCACEVPCTCHRALVARLASAAALARGLHATIVEWPGGEPQDFAIALPRAAFDKVRRGARGIPLREPVALASLAALPWGSLVAVRADDDEAWPTWRVMSGAAKHGPRGWFLPVLDVFDAEPLAAMRERAVAARAAAGYAPLGDAP